MRFAILWQARINPPPPCTSMLACCESLCRPYKYSPVQSVCFLFSRPCLFFSCLSLSSGHFSTYTRATHIQRHARYTQKRTHSAPLAQWWLERQPDTHEYSSTPASGKKVFSICCFTDRSLDQICLCLLGFCESMFPAWLLFSFLQ